MVVGPRPLEQTPPRLGASPDAPPCAPAVSVVLPTLDEAGTIEELIGGVRAELTRLELTHEILVVDGGSTDGTAERAERAGASVVRLAACAYGQALREGLARATGEFVATMDADFSHEPQVLGRLWAARGEADLVIASRYMAGGGAEASRFRIVLSRFLNLVFTKLLRLPVHDASSGYRLYRREALAGINLSARDFDVIEEILVRLHRAGRPVREVPFTYRRRRAGKSHARLVRCGRAYVRTLIRMFRLRVENQKSKVESLKSKV
jgi:dolichol-phosphate mannosyltransferase